MATSFHAGLETLRGWMPSRPAHQGADQGRRVRGRTVADRLHGRPEVIDVSVGRIGSANVISRRHRGFLITWPPRFGCYGPARGSCDRMKTPNDHFSRRGSMTCSLIRAFADSRQTGAATSGPAVWRTAGEHDSVRD